MHRALIENTIQIASVASGAFKSRLSDIGYRLNF